MNLASIDYLLRPLRTAVANLVTRAVVSLVKDSEGLQVLQLGVLDGETRDGLERLQQYGFTSVPLPGAEAAVLWVGGRRDHGLVVAVDDRRYRLKDLEEGEVALYHKDGASVLMKADGSVEVTAKSGEDIVLNGGTKEVARNGDATGSGSIQMTAVPGSGATAITFLWVPQGGGAPSTIGTIALTTAGGTAAGGSPVALAGKITEGAERTKA